MEINKRRGLNSKGKSKVEKLILITIILSTLLFPLLVEAQELWIKNQGLVWPNKEAFDGYKRQIEYLTDEQTIGFIVGAIHFGGAFTVDAQPVTRLSTNGEAISVKLTDGREMVTTSGMLEIKQ